MLFINEIDSVNKILLLKTQHMFSVDKDNIIILGDFIVK